MKCALPWGLRESGYLKKSHFFQRRMSISTITYKPSYQIYRLRLVVIWFQSYLVVTQFFIAWISLTFRLASLASLSRFGLMGSLLNHFPITLLNWKLISWGPLAPLMLSTQRGGAYIIIQKALTNQCPIVILTINEVPPCWPLSFCQIELIPY